MIPVLQLYNFQLSNFKLNNMKNLLTLTAFFFLLSMLLQALSTKSVYIYNTDGQAVHGHLISPKSIGKVSGKVNRLTSYDIPEPGHHFVNTHQSELFDRSAGQGNDPSGTTPLAGVLFALYDGSAENSMPADFIEGSDIIVGNQNSTAGASVISENSGGDDGTGSGTTFYVKGSGVTDIEGNTYKTVIIGNQEWMAENLKVGKYQNGDPIPLVKDAEEWKNLTSGAWCIYPGNTAYNDIYGKMYNWFAVADSRQLCPDGWHVPSDKEWSTLITFLDTYVDGPSDSSLAGASSKAYSVLQSENGYLLRPNAESPDSISFSVRPGGWRRGNGEFTDLAYHAFWWCSEEVSGGSARAWSMEYNTGIINRDSFTKKCGFYVRCIRD